MGTILQDLTYAIRSLSRARGFGAVVIVTLALGIGANTAIFSIVNAVVLRPLSYADSRQLVRITSALRALDAEDTGGSHIVVDADTPDLASPTFNGVPSLRHVP